MRLINRRFPLLVLLTLLVPALAGWVLTGTLVGQATGLLLGRPGARLSSCIT